MTIGMRRALSASVQPRQAALHRGVIAAPVPCLPGRTRIRLPRSASLARNDTCCRCPSLRGAKRRGNPTPLSKRNVPISVLDLPISRRIPHDRISIKVLPFISHSGRKLALFFRPILVFRPKRAEIGFVWCDPVHRPRPQGRSAEPPRPRELALFSTSQNLPVSP